MLKKIKKEKYPIYIKGALEYIDLHLRSKILAKDQNR